MKTIEVEIKGVSPILINRFKESDEQPVAVKKTTKKDYGTPREQAEATPYRDGEDGLLWIPTVWLTGTIRTVASDYKLPGTRKSVKSVSGGAVIPTDEKMYFLEKYKLKDIEVDSRPVVIQRARVMRHRARLEAWSVKTTIEIDEEIIPVDHVHQILNDAGRRAGMGDFRPQKGGPFGRFLVSSWKELKQ
jgi:hypothetical protein